MTAEVASLVERLFEAESPGGSEDWERPDGYYVAACRVSPEDVPGLIDIAQRWNDPYWPDDADGRQTGQDFELLPVTAWRTLADLKADAAVEPLIDMLCECDDEYDEWAAEDLPHVFGKIGEPALGPLTRVATNDGQPDFIRSIAARGLRRVADYHAGTRDRIVACLTEMMASAVDGQLEFCTTLLTELVDLRAVEAAEPIERAFAANLLDVGMLGDWEFVKRKLGVEGLGLKMPENPHNSVEQFRQQMGIGIFSERPLFLSDEIDPDAQEAYHQRAHDTFSQSREAKQVIELYGRVGWFQTLLEFGLDYRGEVVDLMTPASLQEFVLDFVPRKVSVEATGAAEIVYELVKFWEFLERVYNLPAAKSVVEWLTMDGLAARLKAELSDASKFGMAKSIVMLGKNAGYDMNSETGIAKFMAAYNGSLIPGKAPVGRNHRVGRNDPCPCGSGKKYKKCCIRTP